MSGTLTVVQGDATAPANIGQVGIIIPHVCNDINGWGRGFVLAIDKAFGHKPREYYHHWGDLGDWISPKPQMPDVHVIGPNGSKKFDLGSTQFVKLPEKKLVIANMVAQRGIKTATGTNRPPIRYGALLDCMRSVASVAAPAKAEIHCPKFGSDLAGGNWDAISQMILEVWVDAGINVTVYEFVPK